MLDGRGEVKYCIQVLGEQLYVLLGDKEARKLNLPLAELELLWVHDDTVGTDKNQFVPQ